MKRYITMLNLLTKRMFGWSRPVVVGATGAGAVLLVPKIAAMAGREMTVGWALVVGGAVVATAVVEGGLWMWGKDPTILTTAEVAHVQKWAAELKASQERREALMALTGWTSRDVNDFITNLEVQVLPPVAKPERAAA